MSIKIGTNRAIKHRPTETAKGRVLTQLDRNLSRFHHERLLQFPKQTQRQGKSTRQRQQRQQRNERSSLDERTKRSQRDEIMQRDERHAQDKHREQQGKTALKINLLIRPRIAQDASQQKAHDLTHTAFPYDTQHIIIQIMMLR